MGIRHSAQDAAGALGADKALEAVDPNANFLEKAAAAVAGFEGVKILKDHLGGGEDKPADAPATDQGADGSDGNS
jgi:hypothetical protein